MTPGSERVQTAEGVRVPKDLWIDTREVKGIVSGQPPKHHPIHPLLEVRADCIHVFNAAVDLHSLDPTR